MTLTIAVFDGIAPRFIVAEITVNGYKGRFMHVPEIIEEDNDLFTLVEKLVAAIDRYDYCGFEIMLEELCQDLNIHIDIDYE